MFLNKFRRALRSVSWKNMAALGLVVGAFCALILFGTMVVLSRDLPSVEQIDSRQMRQSTKIYDRTGEVLLYEISAGQKRTVVSFKSIPQRLKDAVLAIEDQDFYTNPAFDIKAIIRAGVRNTISGEVVEGGSTITQQLAKNAFLSPEQTYTRKLKELLLAIQLSRHYSKDKIFWLYLNEIPFGPTVYGVGAASRAYFDKPVSELTLSESAVLAALLQAPSYYYPYGSHTDELMERQKLVLKLMHDQGRISKEELVEANETMVVFKQKDLGIKAPHFVLALQDYLLKKYGEAMVRTGGLAVISTLDARLQEVAEKAVKDGAARNEELYKGKNAALVAEDPKTGQILALVGSRDYFDSENQGNFNVVTQGKRQPGSALKPFAYLTLFSQGYLPQTVFFDLPTEFVPNNSACPPLPDFSTVSSECFHPQNYDGDFKGPVSIRSALAQSINIPAVKALYMAGMENVIRTLSDFGITTLDDPRRYGLSVVLGGGEVKLIDMVKAYSTLAQDGVRREQSMILEVRDSGGKILEQFENKEQRVMDPQYVRMLNDVLSDTSARAPLFGGSLGLTTMEGHDIALKTGTTNDYRDAWAMGYTPSLAVGVWAGNNDYVPMQRRGGSILAAVPIWSAFLREALREMPTEAFSRPDPISPIKPVFGGEYIVNNEVHSILYYVDKSDPLGPYPQNPAADRQFNNWEFGVAQWAQQFLPGLISSSTPGGNIQIQIQNPTSGSFIENNSLAIQARITNSLPIIRVIVRFNGQVIQEYNGEFNSPYNLSYLFSPTAIEQNILEVEVVDKNNYTARSQVFLFRR